jgi:predicted outer membrane repeat protein
LTTSEGHSTVHNNTATENGGGIYNDRGKLTIPALCLARVGSGARPG